MGHTPELSVAELQGKPGGSDNVCTSNFATSKVSDFPSVSGRALRVADLHSGHDGRPTVAGNPSPVHSENNKPKRNCESCGGPLTKRWQKRACSHICAGRMAPIRDTSGELNGNFKGWASKRPVAYVNRFKAENPEKARAHQIVAKAVRKGQLVRPATCSACPRVCRPDAHHDDYTKPLAVRWLCRKCHVAADRVRLQSLVAGDLQLQQVAGELNGTDLIPQVPVSGRAPGIAATPRRRHFGKARAVQFVPRTV